MKRLHVLRTVAAGITVATLTACSAGSSTTESAEQYPSDTIRLVTPYDAGGPSDLTARTYAEALSKHLDGNVVVENKPGGSGAVGTQELMTADADGYTLGLVTTGTLVSTPLVNDVSYTPEDFTMLGVMAEVPTALVTSADARWDSAEDFFAEAKAKPNSISVGVPGASTPQAVELRRLKDKYGIKLRVVPFDGNAELIAAQLGGNVDALWINSSDDIIGNIESGKFKALAVGNPERDKAMPDAPTLEELGYKGLDDSGSVFGLAAPAGLPEDIAAELTEALGKASAEPKVSKTIGERFVPDEFKDGQELKQIINETSDIYEPILGK
ncbi:tripartite tricarboxylate transporter substrate binding protein [Janibacter sp. LM]|uniref:Bug family tripartite tricarboxylate transporter substrate binding protein n=1 Tax=Janibacter sp. LM TaxID=3144845 RepID=UPI0031F6157B